MPLSETSNLQRSDAFSPASALDWTALALMVIGSLNWGLIGLMQFDLVAAIFGVMTPAARAVYVLVGIAGIYGLFIAAKWARRA